MSNDELNGWKEIAAYLGKGVRTAQRWEADLGLPVRRSPDPSGDVVTARRGEIDAWRRGARETTDGQRALQATGDAEVANGVHDGPAVTPAPAVVAQDGRQTDRRSDGRRLRPTRRASVAIVAGSALLAIGAMTVAVFVYSTRGADPTVPPERVGSQNLGLAKGGWPTFAHDMQRSNRSDVQGPANPGGPRLVVHSPDGFSYAGTLGDTDPSMIVATPNATLVYGGCGSVREVTLDGRTLWEARLAEKPYRQGVAGITISSAGQYFVATHQCPAFVSVDSPVYLFDQAGTGLARWPVGEMHHAPAVAPNRDWYAITDANLVRGASGEIDRHSWATDLPGYSHGAIALDSVGNLHVGTTAGLYHQPSLWSLDRLDGHVRWSALKEDLSTVAVTDDDHVLVAGAGQVFCFNHDGVQRWASRVGPVAASAAPLAVGRSGNVYVRSLEGLIALDRNGHERWRKPPGDGARIANGPILDKDENVYTALGNAVCSFDRGGTTRWCRPLREPGAMLLAADGVLCVTSARTDLYALESGTPQQGQAVR